MIVILNNIRSMHNVGSIFRTADAAGCKKIYLCGITPLPIDKLGRKRQPIAKVSLGAENFIPWEYTKSITRLIDKLKKDSYKILAVEQAQNSIPYYSFRLPPLPKEASAVSSAESGGGGFSKIALVLGSEIKGLPYFVIKRADKILEIPMRGKKESLNVAVAFGIIAFHFVHGGTYPAGANL
jgi:tRNA G18 (ribose-2'-O)-methylase SpoU